MVKVLGGYSLGAMPLEVELVPTPRGGGSRALTHVLVPLYDIYDPFWDFKIVFVFIFAMWNVH